MFSSYRRETEFYMSVEQGKVWVLLCILDIVKQLETPLPETHQGVHVTSNTAQKEAVKRRNTQKATTVVHSCGTFIPRRKQMHLNVTEDFLFPGSKKALIGTNFEMTNTGGTTASFAYNSEDFLHQRNSGLSASVLHLGSNPQNDTKLFQTMKAKQAQLTYNLNFSAVQFSSSLAQDNENKLGIKHQVHLLQSMLYNQFPITVPLQEKQATYQVIK